MVRLKAWVSAAQAPWQYTARTDEFDTARPHSIKKGLSTDIVQPQGHAGLPSGRARLPGRGLWRTGWAELPTPNAYFCSDSGALPGACP